MAHTVKIILDNYVDNFYFPGQTISGRLECFFDKQESVRAVRIKFKGRAKTRWTRSHGKSSTTYRAEQVYFNQEYNLISGGDDFHLDAGRHTYPFSYILPESLPSCVEGVHGNIRYSIKATVDRPWKFDYEEKVNLNIIPPLDLNSLPGLNNPSAVSVDKVVHRCCCGSDPLTFNIYIPATGYAIGQQINVAAVLKNLSNVSVESVQFKIIQVLRFIAHEPRVQEELEEFLVTSIAVGAIGAHAEKSWTSSLTIPVTNYPNLMSCRIITATYRLEAEVVLPFPHRNLTTHLPITIGNIPLSVSGVALPGPASNTTSYPPTYSDTAPPVASHSVGAMKYITK